MRQACSLSGLHAPTVSASACLPPCCSIGAPESTLELEVQFDSLAELEGFWSAIPQQQHKVRTTKTRVKLRMSVIRCSSSGCRISKLSGGGPNSAHAFAHQVGDACWSRHAFSPLSPCCRLGASACSSTSCTAALSGTCTAACPPSLMAHPQPAARQRRWAARAAAAAAAGHAAGQRWQLAAVPPW